MRLYKLLGGQKIRRTERRVNHFPHEHFLFENETLLISCQSLFVVLYSAEFQASVLFVQVRTHPTMHPCKYYPSYYLSAQSEANQWE